MSSVNDLLHPAASRRQLGSRVHILSPVVAVAERHAEFITVWGSEMYMTPFLPKHLRLLKSSEDINLDFSSVLSPWVSEETADSSVCAVMDRVSE